jgi:hypothetical protein
MEINTMRKLVIVSYFLAIIFMLPFHASAQEVQPISEGEDTGGNNISIMGDNEANFTFEDLGYIDITLQSPFDSTRLRFSTPPNWLLIPTGEVVLEYEVFSSGEDFLLLGESISNYVGELLVSFNEQVIGNIPLSDNGFQTTKLQIPEEALTATRYDGRHELAIALLAGISCDYDIRTTIVIKSISQISLPFESVPPALNLADLPFPFYLRDSVLQDQTLLILPDDPEPKEIQAALNVNAGFGSMTRSDFIYNLIPERQLDAEMLTSSNLVFVGQPEKFNTLTDIEFSIPVSGDRFIGLSAESAEDGVVQLAPSPWNESKTVLLVSGNTTEAVNKAAQAVSSGNIFVNNDPTAVLVADVRNLPSNVAAVVDFTLNDLGYDSVSMSGLGDDSKEFSFFLAKEQVATQEGYIDLKYFHSGLLDYGGSTMVVKINNEIVASQEFTEETTQLSTLRIDIPSGVLRFGENRLIVSANLLPHDSCDVSGFSEYYLTIDKDTQFHIPLVKVEDLQPALYLDLQLFPEVFMTQSDLGNVAFVVPNNSLVSWDIASHLAYSLGDSINPSISNLSVAFADNVPDEILEGKDLILIGRGSQLPLLTEINEDLPAPFDFETDTASEQQMQVIYRLPPGVKIGYLEILSSPFNLNNSLLIVAGNTDEGVELAGNALTFTELKQQLAGLFAVTNGVQVVSSRVLTPLGLNENQVSITGDLFPEAEEIVAVQVPELTPHPVERPAWLTSFITGSVIVIVVILVIALIVGIRRTRSHVTI